MEVKTVRLRVTDLGFADGALTSEIIGSQDDRDLFGYLAPFTGGRGAELGLELCPSDLGPHLRLQYTDQPMGETMYVAMKPITTLDGEPRIFVVAHNTGGLSLDAVRARHDDRWAPDDIFVFCLEQDG
jgi:hypothetical protein